MIKFSFHCYHSRFSCVSDSFNPGITQHALIVSLNEIIFYKAQCFCLVSGMERTKQDANAFVLGHRLAQIVIEIMHVNSVSQCLHVKGQYYTTLNAISPIFFYFFVTNMIVFILFFHKINRVKCD